MGQVGDAARAIGAKLGEWLPASVYSTAFNYRLGWWSALACCALAYYAARLVKSHARSYTALALFAGAWALVAAAIESRLLEPDRPPALADRAQDIASYLLVYSGAILAREGAPSQWLTKLQQWVQAGGLALLFLLVVRSQLTSFGLTPEQVQLFGGEAMSQLGFVSLALGGYAVATRVQFGLLVAVLLAYVGFGLLRTLELASLPAGAPRTFLQPAFVYVFVLERFLLTGVYSLIVVTHARKIETPA
jgi:hypothetical protein